MKTNSGGQLAPDQVVGRDEEIEALWDILESQSVYINAERRIGKTSILHRVQHLPRHGWTVVYRDLENISTAEEFALHMYRDVDQFLSQRHRVSRRLKELVRAAAGAEIGSLKLPSGDSIGWKDVIEKTADDLSDAFQQNGERLLLLWDEVPYMLAKVSTKQGEDHAIELLDTLRQLRQTYPCIRMVLTGSIGLHHVLSQLQRGGHSQAPINDMESLEVTPLRRAHAVALASALLLGEEIATHDLDSAATQIAACVDQFPYYIHALVRYLKNADAPVDAAQIDQALLNRLRHPTDPWKLRHYRTRLADYYAEDEAVVLAALDAVASNQPLTFDAVFAEVKAAAVLHDRERLRNLLTQLQQDHYVQRTDQGAFRFTFDMIRRWWLMERGLSDPGQPQ